MADREHRRDIGMADRDAIITTYGIGTIERRWLALLEGRPAATHMMAMRSATGAFFTPEPTGAPAAIEPHPG